VGALRQICGQELRIDIRPGSGTGPPLLMLGGIGVSYEIFDRLVDALDPGIDIIRVDAPGVGGSPVGVAPYGFPQLAQLLAAMLDELGHEQVDVLGFSWGGALAQQFAAQHRSRCRRLVLISTSTGLLSVPGNPLAVARIPTPRPVRDNLQANSGLGSLYQLATVFCWTSLPFLPLIRQPVLVMGGDDDPIAPVANARILATFIPNATLHVFAGGHLEPLAAAGNFGPMITEFLTSG